MNSREYWQERAEQVANREHTKADRYVEKLKIEYTKAKLSINRDIREFYQKFAVDNEVSFAEARKTLSAGELKEFRMSLEEFIEKAKDNADGRWTKELKNAYYKTRITRLEALQIQIRHQVETLNDTIQDGAKALLSDVYTDAYYRSIYEVQKGLGVGIAFASISPEVTKKIIYKPWIGANFSDRIWEDKGKLLRELETNLAQAFIRGDSIDRTTQAIEKRLNVSYSNAARIVRTETAHMVGEATFDGYKASGVVKKYQFLATLDNRTSDVCQSMDLKVFNISEKVEGVNYPPLHPNCRSTTVAYFDDEISVGERIAKGDDGKSYYVPANINYEQWYEKYGK